MEPKDRLDQIVGAWNLLEHPFYRAWARGELPLETLRGYAREYGAFIRMLPEGWAAVGEYDTELEEHEHAKLWDSLASSLDTCVDEPRYAETKALLAAARRLFSQRESALGALYAFEAQQPATAASKLSGLRNFYRLPAAAESYFEAHADNADERQRILDLLAKLTPAEADRAVEACESMCMHLWIALSGIRPELAGERDRSLTAAVGSVRAA